jgi:hypothetical protein
MELLLPDVWIAAHPGHFLTYRRDEAEAAAIARRRRRERRRARALEQSRSPWARRSAGWGAYGLSLRTRRTAHRDHVGIRRSHLGTALDILRPGAGAVALVWFRPALITCTLVRRTPRTPVLQKIV